LEKIDRLFDIIQKLRSEEGCAWDQKQTPETMWKCLAEEVYELQEGIAKQDLPNICEELGDVLFQLLFIIDIFQKKNSFSFSDVVDNIAKKMIRRHPHVYENARVSTEKELNRQWEAIKSQEKEGNGQKRISVLDAVPKGMPSLIRALKVSKCVVILFTLVNVARVAKFHPETALARSTAKFEGRFRLMETKLKEDGVKLKDLSRNQKDSFWNRAKQSYER